jgi:hypothetical protein
MAENKTNTTSWLSYVNLSDMYERKARFVPGILSFLFLLPASVIYNNFLDRWIDVIISGLGVGCVLAIGISHLASAAGNRFQENFWPKWPYDSPTNQWLHPQNDRTSRQQKEIWFSAIKHLTGLDIMVAEKTDIERIDVIINDAIASLRYRLRNSDHADRLRIHNADYGFARNFTGLRPLWLSFAIASFISNSIEYLWLDGMVLWFIISTVVLIFSFLLAFKILPGYVRVKAEHYAESFFGALIEMNRAASSNE